MWKSKSRSWTNARGGPGSTETNGARRSRRSRTRRRSRPVPDVGDSRMDLGRLSHKKENTMRRFDLVWILVLFCGGFAAAASAGVNSWTARGPEGRDVQILAIDPRDSATVYAGTYGNGIFKSDNGGASWTAAGLPGALIRSLVIDRSSGTIYAGTQQGGVFKRTDGARSWIAIGLGQSFSIEALAVDSSAPG